jgi:hypothetical protein
MITEIVSLTIENGTKTGMTHHVRIILPLRTAAAAGRADELQLNDAS